MYLLRYLKNYNEFKINSRLLTDAIVAGAIMKS